MGAPLFYYPGLFSCFNPWISLAYTGLCLIENGQAAPFLKMVDEKALNSRTLLFSAFFL